MMPTLLTRPIGFMKLPRKAKPFVVFVILLLCLLTCHLLEISPSAHIDQHADIVAQQNQQSSKVLRRFADLQHVPVEKSEKSNDLLAVSTAPPATPHPNLRQSTVMKLQNNAHPIRIAYVLAGSARSFPCPKVHWSIRMNAIDAFGGEAYTFIRLSLEDNMNMKTGTGKLWTPPHSNEEVEEALKILQPRQVTYFNLSTQLEEMQRLFPSVPHRIYQANDLRRYSMYYHRCMAYRMAMEYEQTHDIRFDWIVMIRLDTAWLEPVLPIQYYANDRVWLTETGYTAFNDQFMLVPRQFSDYMFNLDTKVQKGVYCLGGPDVEKWKCNRTELETRQVPSDMVEATLDRCCSDLLRRNNEGMSETIHFHHLRAGKIPVSMTRFLVYITRTFSATEKCIADCSRLHYNYKEFTMQTLGHLYKYFKPYSLLDNRQMGIITSDAGKCVVVNDKRHHFQPITAQAYHNLLRLSKGSKPSIDYSRNLYAQYDNLHPSLQFNPLELNVWRIHAWQEYDYCLTIDFSNRELSWSLCEFHLNQKHGRRLDPQQTFYLHVIPLHNTLFRHPALRKEDQIMAFENMPLPNVTQIVFPNRAPGHFSFRAGILCLTIHEDHSNPMTFFVKIEPCKSIVEDSGQWFYSVQSIALGHMPTSSIGMLRSVKYPDHCLTMNQVDSSLNLSAFSRNKHNNSISNSISSSHLNQTAVSLELCEKSHTNSNSLSTAFFDFEYMSF